MGSVAQLETSGQTAVAQPAVGFTIPPLIKRNTLLFAATQALVGVGTQMIPALSAVMVVQIFGAMALAGLGASMLSVSKLLVAYPIGQLVDTFGRKLGVVVGLLLSLVGAMALGLSVLWASPIYLVAGMLVFGLGVGAIQQLRLAAADMYPPSRRAEGLGYVLTGSLIGAFGGPVLISAAKGLGAGLAVDAIAMAWFLVPVVIVPSLILILLVRPDPKVIAANLGQYYPGYTPPPARPEDGSQVNLMTFIRQYPKRVAFITSFAAQGNMTMMMAMTSLALHHHGHDLPAISLAVAIHVVGMFGLSLPIGTLTDRFGRRAVMIAGVFIAAAGSIMIVITPSYWIITLGTFLVGLGWSCVTVAAVALIADTTEVGVRGRAIGTNDTFTAAAAIVLPLVGGPIAEYFGLLWLGAFGASVMFVPLAYLFRLHEPSPGRYQEAGVIPASHR